MVDANGNRAELRYDGHDRQTRWVFPSKTRPTAFNPATPASAMTSAGALNEADYEEYAYDPNGNRLWLRKRDGRRIAFTYDALNRVTKKDVCATGGTACTGLAATHIRDVFYEYDLRGLQTKARFSSLTGAGITYAYDGFGRLSSETQNTDGTSRTVSSQYNANGNRTRVTYPDGQFFTYDHDGLDRATVLREGTTQLGTASFNNRGLPTQMAWTALAASANARSYGYDPAGRLNSIGFDLHGTVGDVTWGYTRNPASQILSESQSNDSYAWDGHVNLTRAYTTNGLNQYESAGSAAFCYDANGNLTADGGSVYRYDAENRLVEKRAQGTGNTNCAALSYAGASQAQLFYDPTGRLYQVSVGSTVSQRFAYDGNAMIGEYNAAGTMLRRYVHGSNAEADDPLIWYEGATQTSTLRRYLHADPRGSIVAVTDHTGNRIATNSYDEYGIPDTATGNDIATKGRFRYTGQAWIPELGMYYYKARIYSPTLGRFLQTDPIGYEDQFNLYAYVGNDPINAVDPTGEQSQRMLDMLEDAILNTPAALEETLQSMIDVTVGPLTDDPARQPTVEDYVNVAVAVVTMVAPEAAGARAAAAGRPAASAARTCCFVAGTLVDTESGLRAIEEIKVGDRVWARKEDTSETALKEVTDLIQRHERVIWEVSLTGSNGEAEKFETTDDHPWWIAGQGWKRTEELVAGMAVVTRDGRGMVLVSVVETERTDATYNLTVADFETYFVGEQRVLVHNCPGTYRVPGSRTSSGKDYVGQTGANSPNARSGNGRDGRVREAGDQTSSMPGSTRREREVQEQREINAAGGVDNLDNQRNSVSPKKWEKLGIDPPK